jgi:hypothetical protein
MRLDGRGSGDLGNFEELTKTTFGFDDGRSLSSTLVRSCKATGK